MTKTNIKSSIVDCEINSASSLNYILLHLLLIYLFFSSFTKKHYAEKLIFILYNCLVVLFIYLFIYLLILEQKELLLCRANLTQSLFHPYLGSPILFLLRFITLVHSSSKKSSSFDLRTLRAVRVLRPLKLVSGIPSM